ncbi:MAG: hypothetical protein Q9214_001237 [Letrouitia sp. 1 TL-2023]
MLRRLAELNDRLYEMMHDQQARLLEAVTHKTYLEMIQVRSTVDELKQLIIAARRFTEHEPTGPLCSHKRLYDEQFLVSLADFKTLNTRTNEQSNLQPPSYDSAIAFTQLQCSQIEYTDMAVNDSLSASRLRTEGTYRSSEDTKTQIWIEWKSYKVRYSQKRNKHVPLKEDIRRIRELSALLQSEKPEDFCTPRCLGYFDDRGNSDRNGHLDRFGLVFEISTDSGSPISLHQMITGHDKPSLTDRMGLAHRIAKCILYLHAVNWLHKALRSDSILFLVNKEQVDYDRPYLTGYEYARPDKNGETTMSTGGDVNQWWQLYVHPNYQGWSAKGTYRKTFDIYSLGIVLIEIAQWKHINSILDIDHEAAPEELKKIRKRLLQPGDRCLVELKENFGNRFCNAVRKCIEGRSAFGLDEQENEMDTKTGAKLQHEYTSQVVEALETIRI